jgi:uncharacterized protein YbjT (DUF2867 family)
MSSKFDIKSTQAEWILGLIPRDDLVDIAAEALAQGIKSKHLVELAGLSQTETQEAERLFERALDEIGQPGMVKADALKQYARIVSALILASKIAPLEGAKRIWRATLKAGIEGFHDLDGFIYAASELEDRPEDKELFESAIRDEARRWSNLPLQV